MELELEPLFGDEDIACPFSVQIEVTTDGGEPYTLTLSGEAVTFGSERFCAFDVPAHPDSDIGVVQRDFAKINRLFPVDAQKVAEVTARLGKASKSDQSVLTLEKETAKAGEAKVEQEKTG